MDDFRDFYKIDNNSKEIADSLTNRYLNSIFENNQQERIFQQYESLELRDVNDNLNNLKNQVEYLDRIGIKDFPCLSVGETKIPIDIFQYLEDREKRKSILFDYYDEYFYRNIFPEERIYRFLEFLQRENNVKVSSINFETLRSNIKKTLSSFLEIRHASFFNQSIRNNISMFFRGNNIPPISTGSNSVKYLTVSVNTSNHGLDLSASPAYFVTWKKFGSPTSPVDGYLIPATYIFGGSGVGMPSFTHDPTPVDIPPNFNITLTKI